MQHYVSTTFGVSKEFYGGSRSKLAGTGQEDVLSVNICRYSSFIMLKDSEKEELGVCIKSPFTTEQVKQLAVAFFDDNYFTSDVKKVIDKMTKILNKHTRLYEATACRVKFDKTHSFSWKWMRTNGKFELENEGVEFKLSKTSRTKLLGKEVIRALEVHVCP